MLKKESFIPNLLKRVANTQDIDSLTDELLAYIGRETDADRVYIFELNQGTGNLDNTHEWCKEGIEPQIDNLQNMPYELLGVWEREFQKSNNIIISDMEAYRSESQVLYDILKPQGIHSLVVCPLEIQDKYVGFFGVDNPPQKGIDDISGILSELQYTLVIMLRYRAMNLELSRMSFEDQLTGARNRHALTCDGRKLDAKSSIGFVLCDTNGLKIVNDTQGHEAGDMLIRNTANALFEVFGKRHVYRIGGDEFVAYWQGGSEQDFLSRLEDLKAAFQANGVRVAIGHVYSEKAKMEIGELLQTADTRMYADKNKFYGDRGKAAVCNKNDRRKNRRQSR